MHVVVLQMDDRLPEDELQTQPSVTALVRLRFTRHNQKTAAARGWGYRCLTTGHEDKPPWWRKVFALRDLLVVDPERDQLIVLWMETDAHLTICQRNDPIKLATRDPQMSMWISPDAPPAVVPFNAGAFLVRGSTRGRALVNHWCSVYDPAVWARVPSKSNLSGLQKQSTTQAFHWKHTVGRWAGVAYEQGSFIHHLLPMAREYGIRRLPYYVFDEIDCRQPHQDSIVVHLHGRHAERVCAPEEQQCVFRVVHWKPWWYMTSWVWNIVHEAEPKWRIIVFFSVLIGMIVGCMFYHHRVSSAR